MSGIGSVRKRTVAFFRMDDVLMALRYYYAALGDGEKEWAAKHATRMQLIPRGAVENNLQPMMMFRGIEVAAEDVVDSGCVDRENVIISLKHEVLLLRSKLDRCYARMAESERSPQVKFDGGPF